MNWSFNIGDPEAIFKEPPEEVAAPVKAAADAFAQASRTAKQAADDLTESVRTAAAAGYGHSWIGEHSGLAASDVERIIAGENLY
ncbi:hypothetical protein [Paenarthrobacter sp. NPDC018779]|uniref:hypothetical protein n=1 Tax=Paenarthrobacter sp. NPDC018779 TaxID=3364375 RepID=UPI0037C80299